MRRLVRWLTATLVAATAFAFIWLICVQRFGLDVQSAVGVATAAATIAGAPMIWWASQEVAHHRESWGSTPTGTLGRQVRGVDSRPTVRPGDTDDLADQLASAILLQWRAEERI